ncbi:hypothetical protein BDZ97DRAFT_1977970, partial [Flammula alnicola]
MDYGLSRTYGLWVENSRPPTWWTKKSMGYKGLWVISGMGYERFELLYITLDKITQEATVSRLFMAKVYGGNMQETIPKVAAKFVAVHGMNDFMYINKDFQPVAAIIPCAPGLFLGTEPGPDYGRVMRVISKLSRN